MKMPSFAVAVLAIACAAALPTLAATPADILADYARKSGVEPSPERGEKFFGTNFKRQFGWSCASCHGAIPVRNGTDLATEKSIAPFAPAANPKRFTDPARVEFMFKMNCKDVVGRECSAGEKADVLSWLLTLKP